MEPSGKILDLPTSLYDAREPRTDRRRWATARNPASLSSRLRHGDLLAISRMGRAEMRQTIVHLDPLVQECLRGLETTTRGRRINWKISSLPAVQGDPSLLKQVLANLLSNAVKYTRTRETPQIEVGCTGQEDGRLILFVRDNGVGFDMKYAHKLFGVFQRLPGVGDFEGTGIGLANVRRIVARHGGRIWAEAKLNEGATLYFALQPGAEK